MNSDNQNKYDDFAAEIYVRKNLAEADRIQFYRLHKEVTRPNDEALYALILELRSQKKYNEYYILSDEERKEIFKFLEEKRLSEEGLNRYEYNYLNFLIWKYQFQSTASSPCIPEIIDTTLKHFEQQFAFNEQRQEKYNTFIKGVTRCIELYEIDEVEIIVGGSYIDMDIVYPNDIDPLIVLPKFAWDNDRRHSILNSIIEEFQQADGKNTFDLHKILAGLTNNHYMVYELLTLMGNSPESKIENGIRDMKFRCKNLYRLKLKKADISLV
jgi:predicted nucleotidyltransferase